MAYHGRFLPPLDHVDAVLVEHLVPVDGIVLVLLEPVLNRLDDARGTDDVAEGHDPVRDHAEQLDEEDDGEPDDEDEPDRLQLQVVVLQEDDLVVQVPRQGGERGVDGPPESHSVGSITQI